MLGLSHIDSGGTPRLPYKRIGPLHLLTGLFPSSRGRNKTVRGPSGKLVQIEHALTAVGSGQTSLGIKGRYGCYGTVTTAIATATADTPVNLNHTTKAAVTGGGNHYNYYVTALTANGVVIATEKKLPSILVDEASSGVLTIPAFCVKLKPVTQLYISILLEAFARFCSIFCCVSSVQMGRANYKFWICWITGAKDSDIDSQYWSCVQPLASLSVEFLLLCSGMGPDSRVLVRKSRKQAEQYHRLYKEPIPVTQLVRETAAVMQEFTQSGGVRPFGVSLLVAGFDDKGPQLFQACHLGPDLVDPSGSYFSWKASAMGKNVSNAKTFLEKRYTDDMELDDAVHTAILTLKEGDECFGDALVDGIDLGGVATALDADTHVNAGEALAAKEDDDKPCSGESQALPVRWDSRWS
ncbi:hypothetical protein TEA_025134 [Camellia sinensis var. sinensis]|uniref:Proteasome alpha-type subunits domain-containing protein n=1 Tax=Camellia sinensis var. sinensis TaxID=542762 RepID=A0A4S4DM67_CAMSN|nr:hypothetical protein TEA_025134 [Camellia sinensis var. sinensis]